MFFFETANIFLQTTTKNFGTIFVFFEQKTSTRLNHLLRYSILMRRDNINVFDVDLFSFT